MSSDSFRDVSPESKLVIGLVSGSEFINHMYLVLLPPILGVLAADFEVSLAMLGLAIGVQGFSTAVFQLPLGYISDNYGRLFAYGLSLGFGSVGALIVAFAPTFPFLVFGEAILGIGIAAHHPSHYPLLSNAVSESLRGRAFSIRGFAGALGFATPPALVTGVLALSGTTWRHAVALMGLIGAVYGILSIALFKLYVRPEVTRPDRDDEPVTRATPPRLERVKEELAALVSSPPVVALALLAFMMSVVASGLRTFTVVHLTDGYGVRLGIANLTLTSMFVVAAVMILVGGHLADRYRPTSVLIGMFVLVTLLIATFATLVIPGLVAMAVIVAGEGLRSSTNTARDKLVDQFSSRTMLGRSFAVMSVGMMLGATVSPPVFGALIDTMGLRLAFFGIAGAALVATIIAVGIAVSYDRLPFQHRIPTP